MLHDAVFLHVGMPKTGTTYLQEFLWTNRAALRRDGLLYPGDRPGSQFRAVVDLRGGAFAGNELPDVAGSWDRMTKAVRAWKGRSVISHEMMAGLNEEAIERVVASLRPRKVHVVLTVRDLSRIVPATWQEDAKNRFVEPWSDFLDRVRPRADGRRDQRFWNLQDVPGTIERWAERIPAEHIHVVTVPPAGSPRGLLLQRFAKVVDLELDELELDVKVANDSIGPVEVALLHRINEASEKTLPWEQYHQTIKHYAVPRVLAARQGMSRMSLPEPEMDWVREETTRIKTVVDEVGVDVVGNLDDLTPRAPEGSAPDPDAVSDGDQLTAAVDLSVGMAARVYELNGQLAGSRDALAKTRKQLAQAEADLATAREELRSPVLRTKRRVVRFGRRNRQAERVLNVYRRLRAAATGRRRQNG